MHNSVHHMSNAGITRLIAVIVCLSACLAVLPANSQAKRYVCVPCGLPCDSKVFDKPGTCPSCGMALVTEEEAKAALTAAPPTLKAAMLIFDGVEIIDYTGPYEIFGAAGFDVYTVAKTKDPITTAMGMTVVPTYSFADAPQPDVLVVPGGGVKGAQGDTATLTWIKEETAKIRRTMSVCNGSFILASAGLLDGLSATTTNGNIPRLRSQFPKINVIDDQRYVDNGKIITTAGLSAGIDGALHVVELLMGKGAAQQTALDEEYDWSTNARFARAALADRLLPNLYLSPEFGKWDIDSTAGDTDHWILALRGTSEKTSGELMSHFEQKIKSEGKWSKVGNPREGTAHWSRNEKNGAPWGAAITVHESPGGRHRFTIEVTVARTR